MAIALLEASKEEPFIINPKRNVNEQVALAIIIMGSRMSVLPVKEDYRLSLDWDGFSSDTYSLRVLPNGRGIMTRTSTADQNDLPPFIMPGPSGIVRLPEKALTVPILHYRSLISGRGQQPELGMLVAYVSGESPRSRMPMQDFINAELLQLFLS